MKMQNLKFDDQNTFPPTEWWGEGPKHENMQFCKIDDEKHVSPEFKSQSAKIRPKKPRNSRENEMPPFPKPRKRANPS
jgi:hypothetical protein